MSAKRIVMAAAGAIPPAPPSPETPSWIVTLGNEANNSEANGVAVDSNGNAYIVGYTYVSDNELKILVAKYNVAGALQWQRTLNQAGSDNGYAIAVDSSSNVYIAGIISSSAFVAKYNTSGVLQWQKRLTSSLTADGAYGIAVDSAGNVYVAGFTQYSGVYGQDALIVKLNTSGELQWSRKIGDSVNQVYKRVAVDGSGNVYLALDSNNPPRFNIVKYNTSGVLQWRAGIASSGGNTLVYGIAVDSSGNSYVVGGSVSDQSYSGSEDLYLVKYNTSGTLQWKIGFGSPSVERGVSVATDSSGDVYVAGIFQSNGLVAKFTSAGGLSWARKFVGTPQAFPSSDIAVNSSIGGVYVCGFSLNASFVRKAMLYKIPFDGSRTGVYSGFTYDADASLVNPPYASNLTNNSGGSLTESSITMSVVNTALTDAASSLTSSFVSIPG